MLEEYRLQYPDHITSQKNTSWIWRRFRETRVKWGFILCTISKSIQNAKGELTRWFTSWIGISYTRASMKIYPLLMHMTVYLYIPNKWILPDADLIAQISLSQSLMTSDLSVASHEIRNTSFANINRPILGYKIPFLDSLPPTPPWTLPYLHLKLFSLHIRYYVLRSLLHFYS